MDYDKYGKTEAPPILFLSRYSLIKGMMWSLSHQRMSLLRRWAQSDMTASVSPCSASNEIRETLKTAIRIKKTDPHVVTILGGQGATGLSNELIYAQGIDCIMEGEGEIILPILLDYLMRAPQSLTLMRPFNEKAETKCPEKEGRGVRVIDGMNLLFKDKVFYLSPIGKDIASALSEMTFERKINENEEDIVIEVPLSDFILKTTDEKIVRFDIDRK